MNYTSVMEQAMHSAHGVGYAVYSLKHKVRMDIENRRQKEYVKSIQLISKING